MSIGRSQEDQLRNGLNNPSFFCLMYTLILQMLYCCMLHFDYVFAAIAIRFPLPLSGSEITLFNLNYSYFGRHHAIFCWYMYLLVFFCSMHAFKAWPTFLKNFWILHLKNCINCSFYVHEMQVWPVYGPRVSWLYFV